MTKKQFKRQIRRAQPLEKQKFGHRQSAPKFVPSAEFPEFLINFKSGKSYQCRRAKIRRLGHRRVAHKISYNQQRHSIVFLDEYKRKRKSGCGYGKRKGVDFQFAEGQHICERDCADEQNGRLNVGQYLDCVQA